MKAFLVTYEGLWLGGKAFVFAESGEEALALVEAHPETCFFRTARKGLKQVTLQPSFAELDTSAPHVAYNNNGDY